MSLLSLLEWLGITNPNYIPHALTGLFGFLGVVFTGTAAILAWLCKQWLTRRERRNDLRYALWAEIELHWRMLYLAPRGEDLMLQIEEIMRQPGRSAYTPHFTRYLDSLIFNEMRREIVALGRDEIPYVVRFYRHMAVLNGFVDEVRGDNFRVFPVERKLQMIRHVFRMASQAIDYAADACRELERLLNVPHTKRLAAVETEIGESRR